MLECGWLLGRKHRRGAYQALIPNSEMSIQLPLTDYHGLELRREASNCTCPEYRVVYYLPRYLGADEVDISRTTTQKLLVDCAACLCTEL